MPRVVMPVIADVRPGSTRYFVDNLELSFSAASNPVPTAEGSLVISDAALEYAELLHPGAAYQHLETDGSTADWQANLTLADDAYIGLPGPGGRLAFDLTPDPDQLKVTAADLNFVTTAHGIIHVDGVAVGPPRQLLLANGTRYLPGTLAADDLPAHTHAGATEGGSLVIGTTDTDATAGSVFFAGTAGVIQQDNANLFWDDGNNRLGVNTNAPRGTFESMAGSTDALLVGAYLTNTYTIAGAPAAAGVSLNFQLGTVTDRGVRIAGFNVGNWGQQTELGFYVANNAAPVEQMRLDKAGVLTLAAYGAGFVRSSAGGVLSSSALIAGDLPAHAAEHEVGGGDLVDHDDLTNFVANEHINHTGVTLTAGAGLTGGGTIAANRTFAVGAGNGLTVNANDVALTLPGTLTAASSNVAAGNHTHAVTETSDGAANPSTILASDASGGLKLDDLWVPDGGVVGISGGPAWTFDSGGSDISTAANVGINTVAPGGTLEVAGEIRFSGSDVFAANVAQLYTNATSGLIATGVAGSSTDFILTESAGGSVLSNPAGTLNTHFHGDVSIGLTTPLDTLHVEGAVLREGWFCGYAATQAGFTGASTDIDIDTEARKDTDYYTHSGGSDNVTIAEAGWYRFSYAVGVTNTKAGFTVVRVRVYDDGAAISQSGAMCMINDAAVGGYQSSCQNSFIALVGAGSVIDMRTDGRYTTGGFGSNCSYQVEAYSQLTIERVDE